MNFQGLMKYVNKKTIIIAVVAVIIIIVVASINSKNQGQSEFSTEKVSKGAVIKEISETGTVKANEDAVLSFKTSGRLKEVYVKVGDEVKSGQELARLDVSDLLIQLRQAKSDLKIAQAQSTDAGVSLESANKNLENVEAQSEESISNAYNDALTALSDCGSKISSAYNIIYEVQQTYFTSYQGDSGDFIEAKNTIKDALNKTNSYNSALKSDPSHTNIDAAISEVENLLKNTRDALNSARSIAGGAGFLSAVSSTDLTNLDTQRTYINTAYSNLVAAEQAISTAKINGETAINSAKAEVVLLEKQLGESSDSLYLAQLEQASSQVSYLENQISEAAIKSPIDGKITAVNKKIGEIVQPNDSFISLLSTGLFQVKVNIYEGDIIDIREGNSVEIALVAMPDDPLKGVVVSVDPAEKIINEVVYYEVTIGFLDFKEGIKQGMTADIVIEVGRKDDILMIPKRAIEKTNGDRIVKVIKKGKTEERKIEIGLEGGDYVEVVSGLELGEEIITGKKI